MTTAYPGTPYPRTCAFLESVGIDPNNVSIYGFGLLGYYTYDLDKNGHRIPEWDNSMRRTWHAWPSTEVAAEAVDAFWADREAKL